MSQHVNMIGGMMDRAGGGILNAVLQLFTEWSGLLGLVLLAAAVVSSVVTHKVPWTREAGVWLYLTGAAGCLLVHWTDAQL
ncbi:hypothetical protein ACFYE2_06625 [Kocuria sp. CPCC 205300]|uniref:hypothetical protein n=1 Tax=Kocuria sabuli TaxID=3071448 RepID=UPI0036DAC015